MKSNDHSETTCPACSRSFNIDKNRTWKIVHNNPRGFAEAMNQFEHFSEVTCPECGTKFKATEARLFGIFKSPYTVFLICVIVGIVLLGASVMILKPK